MRKLTWVKSDFHIGSIIKCSSRHTAIALHRAAKKFGFNAERYGSDVHILGRRKKN